MSQMPGGLKIWRLLPAILMLGLAACASETPAPAVVIPDSGPVEPPAAAEPSGDGCDDVLAQGRPSAGASGSLTLSDALWETCWRRKTATDIWGEGN